MRGARGEPVLYECVQGCSEMTPASINRQQPKFATIPDDPMATRGSAGCWRTRRLAAGGPGARQQLARFFMCYDGRADSPLPVVAKEWDSEEARAVVVGRL